MTAPSAHRRLLPLLVVLLAPIASVSTSPPLEAQLRPYDPFDWSVAMENDPVRISVGSALLFDQRASLAGTQGRLAEFGTYRFLFRTGRVVLEASGLAFRIFDEESRYGAPYGLVREDSLARRRDVGDVIVATTLLLTDPREPLAALLRFGTRLPTTDDVTGLERDRTDFFALLGARADREPIRVAAELGIGIHGTLDPHFEQADVILYLLQAGRSTGTFRPSVAFVGQRNTLAGWRLRGTEDLSELRAELRVATTPELRIALVRGRAQHSPTYGITLSLGKSF